MNLTTAIFKVRRKLDDTLVTPTVINGVTDGVGQYWLDSELRAYLNDGARLMNSRAQCVERTIRIPATQNASTGNWNQEYELPEDIDEITLVRWWQGTLLPCRYRPLDKHQWGTQITGTVTWFSIRYGAEEYAQQIPGGDIAIQPINHPSSNKPRFWIVLFPTPGVNNGLTVTYKSRHQDLFMPTDEFQIPTDFEQGVIEYAIAQGKRDQQSYGEADKCLQLFEAYVDAAKKKFENFGQEVSSPRLRLRNGAEEEFGGSSWIVVQVGEARYD